MHNPLRSEADAFRWVLVIAAAAASVIALALLIRPAVGAAWGGLLLLFAAVMAWRAWRSYRSGSAEEDPTPESDGS
jgi:hypothetical protein